MNCKLWQLKEIKPMCLECWRIPIVTIIPGEKMNVSIVCICNEHLLTNIEDYVNAVYTKQMRICVNHNYNNSVNFCDVCKEWLCDECIENHQSIKCKEFLPTFPWIKYNKRTLNQKKLFYCVNCNGYLEYSEITHKDHDVINLNYYQMSINKNKIYQLIQKAETYIKEDCPFIYSKVQSSIDDESNKELFKEEFEKYIHRNTIYLDMIKLFFNNYIIYEYENNYQLMHNLIHHSKFDIPHIKKYSYRELLNFFRTHQIFCFINELSSIIYKNTLLKLSKEIHSIILLHNGDIAISPVRNNFVVYDIQTFTIKYSIKTNQDELHSITQLSN